ncbi:hypothetical protein AB4Z46_09990 [Variovorax sp. M-6]
MREFLSSVIDYGAVGKARKSASRSMTGSAEPLATRRRTAAWIS